MARQALENLKIILFLLRLVIYVHVYMTQLYSKYISWKITHL